jgi:hypothetical protein
VILVRKEMSDTMVTEDMPKMKIVAFNIILSNPEEIT